MSNLKHGHRYSNLGRPSNAYGSWQCMKRRVKDKSRSGGHYVGVELEPEWADFENFILDVGEPPDRTYTLDRIDNNKGYVKGNVRWASKTEQSKNRTNNIWFEGQVLKDWCISRGFIYKTVHRWNKEGFTVEEIKQKGNKLWGKELNKNL